MRWVLLATLALAACSGSSSGPAAKPEVKLDRSVPPEIAGLDADAVAEALDLVRMYLWPVDSPPQPNIPALPVGRIYLCAYGRWRGGLCAEGRGADFEAAVSAAGNALYERHRQALGDEAPTGFRFKLDVVTMSRTGPLGDRIPVEELGLVGIAAGDTFLLPSELLELDLAGERSGTLKTQRLRAALARRGDPPGGDEVEWFYTTSFVERAEPGLPIRLYRLHPHAAPAITRGVLAERAKAAADHLVRATTAEGEIRYHYEVARDRYRDDYNWLRHAGTVYALLGAYDRFVDQSHREAARRAIEHLLARTERGVRSGPHGGGTVRYVVSPRSTGPTLKLGGSGLGLLALAEWTATTRDRRYWEQARQLARFLVAAQKQSGEFHSYLPYEPGGHAPDRVSIYYPGEAILALVRWYELDRDPAWLAAARRGADWLIEVRDEGKTAYDLPTDHWLMIGLSHLVKHTPDPEARRRYVEHSMRLARSVLPRYEENVAIGKRYPDYHGGFYHPPRSTPAATRSEGLVAALDTCLYANLDDCAWILDLLETIVSHQLLVQYTPDMLFWVPRPERAAGGFAGGVTDTSIRNDFVQHNLSAILGLERHLASAQ